MKPRKNFFKKRNALCSKFVRTVIFFKLRYRENSRRYEKNISSGNVEKYFNFLKNLMITYLIK